MDYMDELDETMECMCDNDFDLAQFFACGPAEVNRSKSGPRSGNAGNKRKTRRQQRMEDFETARSAVRIGDFAALSKLVTNEKQANWFAGQRGWCLLDEAVKYASVPMVQWLLAKGANPNTLFLDDQPYDFRQAPRPGMYFSPFAAAIRMGHEEIAVLLLARGARLSIPVLWFAEGVNTTCLELAETHGMSPCIEAYLISQSIGTVATTRRNTQRL